MWAKPSRKKATRRSDSPEPPVVVFLGPLPRQQPTERVLAGFGRALTGQEGALEKAQDIMYEAWEAPSRRRAIALARKALAVSPDCADAYVLLAEETARTVEEAMELYRKGVEAGERALGERAFRENAGDFWGLLETRPYMRARAGLAGCLWEVGRREEAVEHYWELLRLNPNDNQGIRDMLMPCLIELGRDQDAERLHRRYKGDTMAVWRYSRALLDFRKGGAPGAYLSLQAALRENRHVPDYLLGRRSLPRTLPAYYSFGDENEAVCYAHENAAAWEATPGALDWLATQVT